MRHAYLILAHHDFAVLAYLVQAIDDERNDIFIHFDTKVVDVPVISTCRSRLFYVKKRVDVRWGDVSIIKAEYALFEEALHSGESYGYYHLLSGVDLPIKSQNYIHDFFQRHKGTEFIGFNTAISSLEVNRKVQLYYLFPKSFRSNNSVLHITKRIIRGLAIRFQIFLGLGRSKNVNFKKGTQWLSVTEAFVKFIIPKKEEVIKRFRYTFCGDEIFLQTLCWESPFRNNVFDLADEGRSCLREIRWINNEIIDWQQEDFSELMQSDKIFARKFSSQHMNLVRKILDAIKKSRSDGFPLG